MGTIRDLALAKLISDGGGGGGGGSSTTENDVNFRDYDGSIVAAYNAADFAALSALPANPAHDGLTAQGWNWTLADAKAYVAKYGRLEIGQMYITDDGKTRVYIHLEAGRTSPMLGVCPNGTVDVDWGDGTAHDTLTGTSTTTVKWTPTHNYAAPGNYVIKLTVTGSMGFYGEPFPNSYSGLLRYSSSDNARNNVYQSAIRRVEIGSGVTSIGSNGFCHCQNLENVTIPNGVTGIESAAFKWCSNLKSVSIPNSMTSIGSNAFYECSNLLCAAISNGVTSIGQNAYTYCHTFLHVSIPESVESIGQGAFSGCQALMTLRLPDSVGSIGSTAFSSCWGLQNAIIPSGATSVNNAFSSCRGIKSVEIPDGVTSIGSNAYQYCYGLVSVDIPDGVTSIGTGAFFECWSLSGITIPESVTSIGGSAFMNCYGLGEIHFKSSVPPTLSGTIFNNVPTDCKIYVPAGSLSDYTGASNYPSSSTYTYVEE